MSDRPANKGLYNDECYRAACSNKNAQYFNKSTRKYYCQTCADLLNKYNKDIAQEHYQSDYLCEFEHPYIHERKK